MVGEGEAAGKSETGGAAITWLGGGETGWMRSTQMARGIMSWTWRVSLIRQEWTALS
jgi:hypothetical protein